MLACMTGGTCLTHTHTHTHTHTFNGPFSGTTRVSRYQKGKIHLDFTEARNSEWQWHQLGHMQVCTLLQTDNHASTPRLCFLQAGCPSCRPTNSVKALKAHTSKLIVSLKGRNYFHTPRGTSSPTSCCFVISQRNTITKPHVIIKVTVNDW